MSNDEWTARVAGLIMAVIAALAIIAFAIVTSALLGPAKAHDMYHDWVAPMGMNCCHRTDCGAWDPEDIEPLANGAFFVRSLGVTITKERVLPSPDGKTHMCCVRENSEIDGPCKKWGNGTYTVRCISVPMGY